MSAQFGKWNLDGKPIECGYLEEVGMDLRSYGPDGRSSYRDKNIAILYYAFPASHLSVRCSHHLGRPPGQPYRSDP